MRRYLGIILAGVLVVTVLIALNAAGSMEFDRPVETEGEPRRSTYNAGPTGLRAFYQLLEQGQAPVERWREKFDALPAESSKALLILVGPFQGDAWLMPDEATKLRQWISSGGRALIVKIGRAHV